MPTVLRTGPYRFFFYAGDREEPPHVHVERDTSVAKFWLTPIRLERSHGFAANEINKMGKLVLAGQRHFGLYRNPKRKRGNGLQQIPR